MRVALPILVMLLASAAVARAETGADHVKVDLLADTTAVQPGKPFTLGVRFKIDPGWHIYWTNPGDSGLPTRVKLDLPAGFTAGDVHYPVPAVLRLPGGLTNYGYEDAVTLLVPVTPPAAVPPGSAIHLSAHVDYLVCREDCLPGSAVVALDLPASETAGPSHAAEFAAAHAGLPLAFTADVGTPAASDTHIGHGGAAVTATVRWAGTSPANVTWIPNTLADWEVDRLTAQTDAGLTTVQFALSSLGKSPLPQRVDGLLISTSTDGHRVGYLCPIQVSAAHAGSPTRS